MNINKSYRACCVAMRAFSFFLQKVTNSKVVSVCVIAFSALISTAAIAEVMARQELLNILDKKIIELSKEGLEINQSLLSEIVKKPNNLEIVVKPIDDRNKEVLILITDIKKISGRLRTVILGGSIGPSETLNNLAIEYQKLLKANVNSIDGEGGIFIFVSSLINFKFVGNYSSTFLIAVSAVLSGIIGSLVTVFRLERYSIDFLKRVVLGITTGYISFLLIKGGRSLFLLEGTDTLPMMNPYSSALFSLIGGMFTEKFFKLLGDLFDGLIKKITQP